MLQVSFLASFIDISVLTQIQQDHINVGADSNTQSISATFSLEGQFMLSFLCFCIITGLYLVCWYYWLLKKFSTRCLFLCIQANKTISMVNYKYVDNFQTIGDTIFLAKRVGCQCCCCLWWFGHGQTVASRNKLLEYLITFHALAVQFGS